MDRDNTIISLMAVIMEARDAWLEAALLCRSLPDQEHAAHRYELQAQLADRERVWLAELRAEWKTSRRRTQRAPAASAPGESRPR